MPDIDALEAVLAGEIAGFDRISEMRKFNTGQSNPTYLIVTADRRFVLRAKPPGQLLKSAHQVDREFRVMRALGGTAVPVPRVHYLSPEDSVIGRMFFVMEHLDGRILWDPALPELSAHERQAIYDAMVEALAALHDVDIDAAGLSDFGRPGNYFERQLKRWSEQYRASVIDPITNMDALIDWLSENLPKDDGQVSLVHGDFRMDNMIFARDSATILGVLDWELSTLGHPYADLSYQCMQLRLPHDSTFKGLGGLDRAALGIPSEEEYVTTYCRLRGIDRIDNWRFYLAFAFFRLGAILQGVLRRAVDGNASNPERAREMGRAIPLIASEAIDVIRNG
ncbi:phosphotransferase family protein [Georhizobium profundi]|uniref:Phosphotransferase family protein n=2 Tax=Georhizobium profundi TaxID=2341112 RepID=A0A3S9B9V5_9HYPH|nr:phosphotransferase [Georhizobium profundi]AZN73712.1 phosphotransferase family protein [Georhizobium profundi]